MSEQIGTYRLRFETDGSGLKPLEDGFERVNVKGREFRHILTQMGGGQIAELLRAASGPLIIAEGLVEIYKQIKIGMDQIHEQQLMLIQGARTYHEELRTAGAAAMQSQVDRAAEWNREMSHLEDKIDEVGIAEKSRVELLKQQTTEMAAQSGLAASLAEAHIGTLEAEGALTHEQAEIRILALKQRQKEVEQQMENLQHDREVQSKRSLSKAYGAEIATAAGQLPGAESERERVQHLLNLGQGELKRKEREADAVRSSSEEAQALLKKSRFGMSEEELLSRHQGPEWELWRKSRQKTQREADAGPLADEQVIKQKDLNAGYENLLKDQDAEINSIRDLIKSRTLLKDQLDREAGEMFAANRERMYNQIEGNRTARETIGEATTRAFMDKSVRDFGAVVANSDPGYTPGQSPDWNAEVDVAQGHLLMQEINAGMRVNPALVKGLLDAIKQVHGESQEAKAALDQMSAALNQMSAALNANLGH